MTYARWFVGIDENGLGPQLGPLVVTAVMARANRRASEYMCAQPNVFLGSHIGDSKRLVSHERIELAEAWARVLARAMLDNTAMNVPFVQTPTSNDAGQWNGKTDLTTPEGLLHTISLSSKAELQRICPAPRVGDTVSSSVSFGMSESMSQSKAQCWRFAPSALQATDALLVQVQRDYSALREQGLDVVWVRSVIVCVKRMHEALAKGRGRLDLDLRCMEELILAAREYANEPIIAHCGKVGNTARYDRRFSLLSSYLPVALEQTREKSSYQVANIGTIHFLLDAESQNPLVCLASLVGKWMREQLMSRITRYYQHHDESLPNASGYNDPVTSQFVAATSALRSRLSIEETCFLRPRSASSKR